MTAVEQTVVWEGAEALRPFLVPIAELEPFPGNPRRGDAKMVAGSLRRFGQLKPIVVDGSRIVAGHHVVLAAQEEMGWSHVAVLSNKFTDEDEQRAFLLADNRTSDVGGYDAELLVEHLRALAEIDALDGTGYTTDDLDGQLAALRRQMESMLPADETNEGPLQDPQEPSGLREVVLLYSPDQRDQFEAWLKMVAKEKGTNGVSETCYVALELAARTLNQGE